MQTLKAAAVEPQWQDRWERQLAAYSAANQRVINLGNSGSQAVQLISKLSLAAILFFGAQQVIAGALTVGGLVAGSEEHTSELQSLMRISYAVFCVKKTKTT